MANGFEHIFAHGCCKRMGAMQQQAHATLGQAVWWISVRLVWQANARNHSKRPLIQLKPKPGTHASVHSPLGHRPTHKCELPTQPCIPCCCTHASRWPLPHVFMSSTHATATRRTRGPPHARCAQLATCTPNGCTRPGNCLFAHMCHY